MIFPKVTIVLNWRNETNLSGLYCIHMRIHLNGSTKYYKIDIPQKVRPEEWSGKEDCWVKSNHPFAFEINNKIIDKKNIINGLIKSCYNLNKNLSFEAIFSHLKRKGDVHSFYQFMHEYILNPPEKLEENTMKKYRTTLSHLKRFRKQLFFSDIDSLLIKDFHKYMQTELKLEGGACKKYMEAFKKVIRQGRKENYIDPSQMEFLFDDVKIKVPKPKRTFLEAREIKALKELVFPFGKEYLEKDRDMFLFQVYTGYYYKDLFIFSKAQLINDEEYGFIILGARDKNANKTIIPLFKFTNAVAIIEKYKSTPDETMVFARDCLKEEPAYNRNLKEMARLAGISKNISNKVARHTNAQLWIRYGAKGAILSKMMGHTKEETTRNYYDVNIPEIVEGTRLIDFERLDI
jgi:integrase